MPIRKVSLMICKLNTITIGNYWTLSKSKNKNVQLNDIPPKT